MPEEINRVITDGWLISCSLHPKMRCKSGHEGIPAEKIYRVGNVMIDSLCVYCRPLTSARGTASPNVMLLLPFIDRPTLTTPKA